MASVITDFKVCLLLSKYLIYWTLRKGVGVTCPIISHNNLIWIASIYATVCYGGLENDFFLAKIQILFTH